MTTRQRHPHPGDEPNWRHVPRLEDMAPGELMEFLRGASVTHEDVVDILFNVIRRICEQETRIQRLETEARMRGGQIMPGNEAKRARACPWCGAEQTIRPANEFIAHAHGRYRAVCVQCGASASWADSITTALAAWNTRPIEDALIAALESAEGLIGNGFYVSAAHVIHKAISDAKGGRS